VTHATLVVPLNIEQLIERADRIFLGTVLSNTKEPKGNGRSFPSIVTRFKVEEVYKGKVGSIIEVRQIAVGSKKSKIRFLIGIPRFSTKGRYIVFLAGESSLGFASPIGLGQGVFEVPNKGQNIDDLPLLYRSVNQKLFQGIQKPATQKLIKTHKLSLDSKGKGRLTVKRLRELISAHQGAQK